ncbi:MAG: redoxin domain-containing protein [Phycisphaerales bacterium]
MLERTARTGRGIALALLCCLITVSSLAVTAQDGGTTTAPAGARTIDDPSRPAAQALIEKVLERYKAARSYTDSATIQMDMQTEGDDAGMFGDDDMKQELTLAFAQPNRLSLVSPDITVVSDGTTMWTALGWVNQYTEKPAPATMAELNDDVMASPAMIHPILGLILKADEAVSMFPSADTVTRVVPEIRQGHAGQRLHAVVQFDEMMGMPGDIPVTMWVADETGYIGEFSIDMTEAYKEAMKDMVDQGMPKITKFATTMSFDDVHINADIPAERFVFTPEESFEKVDEFDMGGSFEMPDAPDQQAMVDQPAPAWEGKDLDGKNISLADFSGKVVVMDFWATWCGPCIKAMPDMQKIADTFSDQPVAVLGINADAPGSDEAVRAFLESHKFTMRQVMDDGSIGSDYGVSAIPCVVIVDQKGVVRDVSVGYSPNKAEHLTEVIEKLLKE